jgi:hypothetical protein
MYDVASADEVWPSACIEPGDFSTVNANALGCLEEITCVLHLTIEPLQDNLKGVASTNNNVRFGDYQRDRRSFERPPDCDW